MNIPKTKDGKTLNYDRECRPLKMGVKPTIRYTVTGEPYKQCSYYKSWMPLSEFDKSSSPRSKDGYTSVCRKAKDVIANNMKKSSTKSKEEKPNEEEPKEEKPEQRTLVSTASDSSELAAEWRQRSGITTGDTLSMLYELRRRGIHGTVTYIDMPIEI